MGPKIEEETAVEMPQETRKPSELCIHRLECKMEEDPYDAEYCHKHVKAITSTLPVAGRAERRHL